MEIPPERLRTSDAADGIRGRPLVGGDEAAGTDSVGVDGLLGKLYRRRPGSSFRCKELVPFEFCAFFRMSVRGLLENMWSLFLKKLPIRDLVWSLL